MTKLEGASYGPHNEGKPGHMVILLHGYGADGNDLIGLAPVLAPADARRDLPCAQRAATLRGQSLRLPVVSASRASTRQLALAGVHGAAADVDAFLDEKMAEYGLDESKTAPGRLPRRAP